MTEPRLPFALRLNMVLATKATMAELWQFVHDVLVNRPGFEPSFWRLWSDRDRGASMDAGKVVGAPPPGAFVERGADAFAPGFEVQGRRGGLMVSPVARFDQTPEEIYGLREGWRLWSYTGSRMRAPEDFHAEVELCTDALRAAIERFDVLRADLRRVSNSTLGPVAPLADPEEIARLVIADEVACSYPEPDHFWRVWDRVEHLREGRSLCTRALGVADELEFKRRSMTDGFSLGRAAKPGTTQYYAADPSPEEAAWLRGLPRYLTQIGYDTETCILEFTAVVEPGEHLSPADLLDLLAYLTHGTADGQAVEQLVVTFPDEPSALAHAGPLRDIGVRIQYLATDGTWAMLT